jgi:tetratricopeptide (TPR) repeat protein
MMRTAKNRYTQSLRRALSHVGVWSLLCLLWMSACKTLPQPVKNSFAYFNTYYNANRLMVEAEDKFFDFDDAQRVKPRIVVIEEPTLTDDKPDAREVPQFIRSLVITPEKLQPVRVLVDSILIKGSKILSRHAQSDLVDATLFLMAKAYFYKSEWFAAQLKCQEMVDAYPYSTLSPDAHLLLAKSLLMQIKFPQAENALSKAIDIAWGQHRYDALSEAFRIQAEIALHLGNVEEAAKPYRRAIAQADDNRQKAQWQLEVGLLYYRQKKFAAARAELLKAIEFSPDALTRYEMELYTAAATTRLAQYDDAEKQFAALLSNRNYTEWRPYTYGEYVTFRRLSRRMQGVDSLYALADTMKAKEPIATARYLQALDLFKQREYKGAQVLFVKSLVETSPTFFYASRYASLLTDWQIAEPDVSNGVKKSEEAMASLEATITALRTAPNASVRTSLSSAASADTSKRRAALDTSNSLVANSAYRLGRIQERLGVADSARLSYAIAANLCPVSDSNRARYLYAEAATFGLENRAGKAASKLTTEFNGQQDTVVGTKKRYDGQTVPQIIDSLLNAVAVHYPHTQQGIDARIRLGYTEKFFHDAADDAMQSADRLRQTKQFSRAVQKYQVLSSQYADSRHTPRAFYVQGWLYERELGKRDSAIYWYKRLVERFPQSSFAQEIKPSLDALLQEQRLQDSLRLVPAFPIRTGATTATLQASTATISTDTIPAAVQSDAAVRRRR